MIDRPFWAERLAAGWKQASIVWLTGPRRTGKTVLAQSLPDAEFLNCDLTGRKMDTSSPLFRRANCGR